MKIFIKKSILFFVLIILFIESVSFILLLTNLYLINYPGSEIYNAIEKSKKKYKARILLLGDSVGEQLFPNKTNNDSINSLACNQAIGVVGQFLLLNNYLEAGNNIDKVIILFTPFSFRNNLDQEFTYHYFLKPFYNSEYIDFFSATVKEQINKIPYNSFVQFPHIRVTTWAPKFNSKDYINYTFLSPISIEYLNRIKALSIQYGFELDIIPTPVNIEKKALIENMDLNEITLNNFNQEFKNYFSDIVYLESTEFSDGTHLIAPDKHKNKINFAD